MSNTGNLSTGRGDSGQTSLTDGSRISKASLRVKAYGSVDELNSWLGMVLTEELPEGLNADLRLIQHELFDLGSELATPPESEVAARLPSITTEQVQRLKALLIEAENLVSPCRQFILPGGCKASALLHLARAVARRAERDLVALEESGEILNPNCLIYLNRLSDLCFIWGRQCNNNGEGDLTWQAPADRHSRK